MPIHASSLNRDNSVELKHLRQTGSGKNSLVYAREVVGRRNSSTDRPM